MLLNDTELSTSGKRCTIEIINFDTPIISFQSCLINSLQADILRYREEYPSPTWWIFFFFFWWGPDSSWWWWARVGAPPAHILLTQLFKLPVAILPCSLFQAGRLNEGETDSHCGCEMDWRWHRGAGEIAFLQYLKARVFFFDRACCCVRFFS